MKPIIINITNLIGTVVVATDKDLEKIEKVALETLHRVVSKVHNSENQDSKIKSHHERLNQLKADVIQDFDDALNDFLNDFEPQ